MRDVEFSMLLLQLFSKSKMSSNECLKKNPHIYLHRLESRGISHHNHHNTGWVNR